jgi:hypothetical protein
MSQNQNYDVVVVDLGSSKQVNLLSATERMEYADPTDCIEDVALVDVSNEDWVVNRDERVKNQRVIVFGVKHHGKHVGRIEINTQTGELQSTWHEGEDVKVSFRVLRINYNRRRR